MNPLGELMQSIAGSSSSACCKPKSVQTRKDRINNTRYSPFKDVTGKILWCKVFDKWDARWITPSKKLIKSLERIW